MQRTAKYNRSELRPRLCGPDLTSGRARQLAMRLNTQHMTYATQPKPCGRSDSGGIIQLFCENLRIYSSDNANDRSRRAFIIAKYLICAPRAIAMMMLINNLLLRLRENHL